MYLILYEGHKTVKRYQVVPCLGNLYKPSWSHLLIRLNGRNRFRLQSLQSEGPKAFLVMFSTPLEAQVSLALRLNKL